jgi:FAD/FMN-containing dehydrogenase
MNAITDLTLARLKAAAGPNGAIDDPADMAPYLVEPRGLYNGKAALVLRPDTTERVAEIVRICAETGTRIVPQGGNTGLVGGSVPFDTGDEVVLSLNRMRAVRAIDLENDTMTVEAGCPLAAVHDAAEAKGRMFPLRIASEGTCTIGGNLSTNAGGNAVLRYGNMRDLVLGLEVVLPDGRIWNGLRGLRKDNTGYDLKQLFIGAEGTLGIITAAVLKLFPRPAATATAFVAVRDVHAAVELLGIAKRESGGQVSSFELLPRIGIEFVLKHTPGTRYPLAERHQWCVLMEMTSGRAGNELRATMEAVLAEGMEAGLVLDAVLAESEQQAKDLWRLRESMSDAQRPEGGSIKHDISVPVSLIATFIERATREVEALIPGTRIVAFGHIGDGNVHFNPSQPVGADKQWFLDQWDKVADIVHGIAHELGGSISAEHGLGRMKREEITHYKSPVEIDLMRTLKAALDPKGIMNPGKVV